MLIDFDNKAGSLSILQNAKGISLLQYYSVMCDLCMSYSHTYICIYTLKHISRHSKETNNQESYLVTNQTIPDSCVLSPHDLLNIVHWCLTQSASTSVHSASPRSEIPEKKKQITLNVYIFALPLFPEKYNSHLYSLFIVFYLRQVIQRLFKISGRIFMYIHKNHCAIFHKEPKSPGFCVCTGSWYSLLSILKDHFTETYSAFSLPVLVSKSFICMYTYKKYFALATYVSF